MLQVMSNGGSTVNSAGSKALTAGTTDALTLFLTKGQYKARENDDRVELLALMNTGGPAVKQAAQEAMGGGPAEIREFLESGQHLARARDQETMTVAQLGEVARKAGLVAKAETEAATNAADQAVKASQAAKESAERAAKEMAAAKNDSVKAAEAAGRAARAADGAAAAARTAISAAGAATSAARTAAAAASAAAAAASAAGEAAARAYNSATATLKDAGQAETARKAAEQARDAAAGARTAAKAALASMKSVNEAVKAAQAAASAGENAAAAAGAAAQAGTQAGIAVAKGRIAAVRMLSTGGPWTRKAAETALSGGDEDIRAWLGNTQAVAAEQDDRARVAHLSDTGPAALKTAADAALKRPHAEVVRFLERGQHDVQADAYRVKVLELSHSGGPAVKKAASAAIDAGTTDALRAFLGTGHVKAQEDDDRVETLRIMNGGGPETKAAAQIAMAGPASMAREFVASVQYKAAKHDNEAATHEAGVKLLLAEAARVAARAGEDSAKAAGAALKARDAAADATQYAKDAVNSAAEADASAARAAESARLAKNAAATANQAAAQATAAEQAAAQSAAQARTYASMAAESAEIARQAALKANKDAHAAAEAAKEALDIAAEKQRKEDEARRDQPNGGSVGQAGDGATDALQDYENGVTLLWFDGGCYINGTALPAGTSIDSCKKIASDFDSWMGDVEGAVHWDALLKNPDPAKSLLAAYCSYDNNNPFFGGDKKSKICGPALMKDLDQVVPARVYSEAGGGGRAIGRLFKQLGKKIGLKTKPRLSGPAFGRTQHELYKQTLREEMAKPVVADSALKEFADKLYRANAKIGSGSTAAAVRFEAITGKPVGNAFHTQKAEDAVSFLYTWLKKNPVASQGDRAAAENLIKDMEQALQFAKNYVKK
ncbi:ALF repeat-containing protein [Streptomyces flavotricini]|uniref:ALF repeat-containing protein n=1 Tax=Streptomyces flavotricini TaxID=66888 RepID=A0ABS8EJ82_9ACTN|nr:ALF repeat-containing protein [Streptomyces flavotricini]MCC0100259.1 ALF repeat-containing protein [Streptomyces flavotricini]